MGSIFAYHRLRGIQGNYTVTNLFNLLITETPQAFFAKGQNRAKTQAPQISYPEEWLKEALRTIRS